MRDLLSPDRVWTPSRYQFQTTECGVGSLGMILAHYGRDVPLEDIRKATGVSRDCLNAADVVAGARAFGLDVKVRTCEPERLAEFGFPAIIHLNFIHFVVLEGINDTHILLNDPHAGRREIELKTFDDSFTGITLTFSPSDAFEPDAKPHVPVWHDWLMNGRDKWLAAGAATAQVAATLSLISAIFAAVMGAEAAAIGAAVVYFGARMARDFALGHMRMRMADRMGRELMAQMLRLSRGALAYRMPNRLAEVIGSSNVMAGVLCDRLLPIWLAIGSAPLFLIAIVWLDPVAGVSVATATIIFGVVARVVIPWRRGRQGPGGSNGALPFASVALALMEPKGWKFGGEDRSLVVNAMSEHATQSSDRLRLATSEIANNLVAWMVLPCLLAVALLALLGRSGEGGGTFERADAVIVMLLTAALGGSLRRLPGLRGQWHLLQRLLFDARDLLAAPTEPDYDGSSPEITSDAPALKISDIVFGYSSRRPVLLNGVGLELRQGEQLGITGPSGGGKSTIGRILAGVNEPWSGTAEMFGAPLGPANHPVWLDKAPVFFEASLRDNLTLWDRTITDRDILRALDAACLGDEIARRPEGLETHVEARGRNFSGGQLQRLEIARALLRGPRVLILDEAVDAMNPSIEAQVRENLRARGISLVVISHRASTLGACDRVVTFVGGQVVEGVQFAARVAAPPAKAAIDQGHTDVTTAPVDGLQAAFAEVCRAEGVSGTPRGATLTALAASVGVMFRFIQFKSLADWRHDRPTLLALPTDGPAYAVPGNAALHPRDRVTHAVQIYDIDAPDRGASGKAIIARARRAAFADSARMAAACLLTGAVIALLPLMAAGGSTSWPAAIIAMVLVVAGLALLNVAAAIAALRVAHRIEGGVMFALMAKCRKIEMAALQRMPRYVINDALRFVGEMATRIRTTALSGAVSAGMMGGGSIAVAAQPGRAGGMLVGFCALILLTPVLITWFAAALRHREKNALGEEMRMIHHVAASLHRLRSLGRDNETAAVALQMRGDATAMSAALSRNRTLASAAPRMLALIALIVLLGTLTDPHPGVALIAALSLTGAVWLSDAVTRTMVQAHALENFAELCAQPVETGMMIPAGAAPLIADNISYQHGDVPVLRGVRMSVEPGKITVLAGASGSGKSTLLNILLGVERPAGGDVCYGQTSLNDLNLSKWRARIGAVFQNDQLETAGTIRGQLSGAEPITISTAWRLLEQVEMAHEVDAMPMGLQTIVDSNQISTGQQQRLLIARQLAAAPEILVLDEAMNAVPDDVQARLIANFRERGLTCLIVTHRASTIALADRVVVLEKGAVVHDGAPGPVLARPDFQSDLTAEHMLSD